MADTSQPYILSSNPYLYLVKLSILFHLFAAPWTKVEESFNVQALHDILYHGVNISQYDHLVFPGVVPRTFTGPVMIAGMMTPLMVLTQQFTFPKYAFLLGARLVLGYLVWWSFGHFASSQEKLLGRSVVNWLCAITATQFHFCFYATRPLPNVFALILALLVCSLLARRWGQRATILATVSAAIFRAELVVLYAPLFLAVILVGQLKLHKAISAGIGTLLLCLAITVPLDSLLWNRWVWPEAEVWWYNVVENKSHNWGTSPLLWYFYSALPRALGASLFLVPVGLYLEPRLLHFTGSGLFYVVAFSLLPHKELRFIIYVLPLLNVAAAAACARIWMNRWKSFIWKLLSFAVILHLLVNVVLSGLFIYGSANNYPGGEALYQVHRRLEERKDDPITIHIDVFNAQTGISRFLQENPSWSYNKSEDLTLYEKSRFDILLIGEEDGPSQTLLNFYRKHHVPFYTVSAFRSIQLHKTNKFPFLLPKFHFVHKVSVLRRKNL